MELLVFLPQLLIAMFLFAFLGLILFSNSSLGKSSGWGFWKILRVIINPASLQEDNEGAEFMSDSEMKKFLHPKNEGLLINGVNDRLSRNDSYTHCLLTAPPGMGKTTKFVIPNILTLADTPQTSIVVTDPSGEIHGATAGYLERRGFEVQVVCPHEPNKSLGFNPLASIASYSDIQEQTETLVGATTDIRPGDKFWTDGADAILNVLVRILGLADHKKYLNLPNLYRLLQNVGEDGSGLDRVVMKYGTEDEIMAWKGTTAINSKTFQSFLSTAMTNLKALANPDLAKMMAHNEVDFKELRRKPVALFVVVPSEKIAHYSFFLSLFYNSLFQTMMKELPQDIRKRGEPCNSVYCIMDEAGHSKVPNMGSILTIIRKYECSISMVLQSLSQLEQIYSKHEAETILEGGVSNRIFMGGLSHNTSTLVEKMLGRQVITDKRDDGTEHVYDRPLMRADRIRVMKDDELLFISRNREAMMLNSKPFYEQRRLLRKTQRESVPFGRMSEAKNIEYILI